MRLLLIEDDFQLCQILKDRFDEENIKTEISYTGKEGIEKARTQEFDIIILDCILPDINGNEILKEFRFGKISIPVIMLTALGTLQDKLTGLNNGADDYIVKPFEFDELLARIHSVLRRSDHIANNDYYYGDISYNLESHIIRCGSESVQLSKKESLVFEILIKEAGRLISKSTILDRVWGADTYVYDGNLGNYIYFIRNRLKTVHSKIVLKTVHGIGYGLIYGDFDV